MDRRLGSWLTNWKSSHPVTPTPRDYPDKQVDSWDFQNPCGVQPPAAEVDISTVYRNAKRKLKARSPYERPRKARKRNKHQSTFSTELSDKEDVEDSNTTNGGWYERELDRNLRQMAQQAAALNSWDDPFVDTPPPSPYSEAGESVTESATDMEAEEDAGTDTREETNSTRKDTCARLEEMEEKLALLQNSSRRMTRAQSQELARLSEEYSCLCAEFFHIPQDLSPSSALPQSIDGDMGTDAGQDTTAHHPRSESLHSSDPLTVKVPNSDDRSSLNARFNTYYSNNTNTLSNSDSNTSFNSDSTSTSPSDPAIPLRTLQDFEEYHQYLKIQFGRAKTQVYQDAPKVHRQVREEKLFLLLANKKRRVKKYWDALSQRSGEMGSERYIRLASRSPSDSAPGFYEKC
ncbi:hypothetical protein N0V85_008300 [Neurospora sp. IMI 360204]|nr:hypothetical protein N0V85_008300 [Neurospora sp. IMI 360204]